MNVWNFHQKELDLYHIEQPINSWFQYTDGNGRTDILYYRVDLPLKRNNINNKSMEYLEMKRNEIRIFIFCSKQWLLGSSDEIIMWYIWGK